MTVVRLRWLTQAVLSAAAVSVLWRYRPEWPQLPTSLSAPVTTVLVQQLVLVAAWTFSSLLLVLLLVRSLRRKVCGWPVDRMNGFAFTSYTSYTSSPAAGNWCN